MTALFVIGYLLMGLVGALITGRSMRDYDEDERLPAEVFVFVLWPLFAVGAILLGLFLSIDKLARKIP